MSNLIVLDELTERTNSWTVSLSDFAINLYYYYIYIIIIKLFVQILKQNCSTVRSFGLVTICEPPCLPILPIFTSNLASILMQKDMFCMQISLILQIYSPATILLPPAPCPLLLAPCSLPPAPYKSDVWKYVSLYFFFLTYFHALRQHFLGR